jgi:histone-lysine N-methyltransferase SETMAR
MDHPPHSPDLSPNELWLFPKIKSTIQGRRFQDTEDIQKNVTTTLEAIPQHEFEKCFQQ